MKTSGCAGAMSAWIEFAALLAVVELHVLRGAGGAEVQGSTGMHRGFS